MCFISKRMQIQHIWQELESRVHGRKPWPWLVVPVLAGLSQVWSAAAVTREIAYAYFPSLSTRLPVERCISIGNVSVGGTGKTPMVQFLAREYAKHHTENLSKCMVLTRGYGKDEEFELRSTLPGAIIVAGADRTRHAKSSLAAHSSSHSQVDTILLDDGLQHHQIRRDINIVMVNALNGCQGGYTYCLPRGPLREPWARGLTRADAVVLHHGSLLDISQRQKLCEQLQSYSSHPLRFFASDMRPSVDKLKLSRKSPDHLILVSGIGCHEAFEQTVRHAYPAFKNEIENFQYSDHYKFTEQDLLKVLACASSKPGFSLIVTTAKDFARTPEVFQKVFPSTKKCELLVLEARLQITSFDKTEDYDESDEDEPNQNKQDVPSFGSQQDFLRLVFGKANY